MVWDTTTLTIRHLFETSANFCLELRSLAPRRLEELTGRESEPGAKDGAEPSGDGRQHLPPNTWCDVEISFFNEHSVQITVGHAKSVKEFGEVGMAHRRSGKPRRAWQMLHALALSGGVINRPENRDSDWTAIEKRMQELRAWFRDRFGLTSDPLPYVKGTGYRADFRITVAPSYRK
jgi:hypothetical protein